MVGTGAGTEELRLRIGGWLFEPALNRLTSDDCVVELEPLGSRLLETLAGQPGRVFSNDELVEAVWQGRIVSDNPIYKLVANLRSALGDDRTEYIETIRKRGYRLVAPVERVAATRIDPGKIRSDKRLILGGIVIAALAIVVLVNVMLRYEGADATAESTAIAVLPFEDMSPAGDKAYLGDGLAEEIIHTLTTQRRFAVIGRTSSFAVAGEKQDLREIGRQLGARYILEGSVRQWDDQIRVTAQLIDAADGLHLWSENFNRPFGDVLAIQSEIAARILEAVAAEVGDSVTDATPAIDTPAVEIAAYDAYLRGRQALARRTAIAAAEAEKEFLRALELQPDMLGAMTGLVHSQWTLNFHGQKKPEEAYALAQKYAERALLVAPRDAAAHTSIGVAAQINADWARSEHALRTAIDLQPNNAVALSSLALMLQNINRPEEAREIYRKVLQLEPASAILAMSAAMNTEDVGEFACADYLYRRAVSLAPDLMNAQFGLGSFLWRIHRRFADGQRHLRLSAQSDPEGPIPPAFLALLYLDLGDTERAGDWIEAIPTTAVESYWPSFARMAYATFVDDQETARELASGVLRGSAEINALRLLRDEFLAAGDADAAVNVYPEWLRGDDLQWVTRQNVRLAADLAFALKQAGRDELARRMATKVLEVADTMPRHGWRGFHLADVTANLILNGEPDAFARLELAYAEGLRTLVWWELDHNYAFAGLREREGFQALRDAFTDTQATVRGVTPTGGECSVD